MRNYPVDQHMVTLMRRVFMRDSDSRAVLAILLRDMGYFSPISENAREVGVQEYARRLMQMVGIGYSKKARSYLDALLDNVPEMWDTTTDKPLKKTDMRG